MIYETINQSQFIDAFKAIRPDNFSHAGLCALYDYLEELSENEPVELDVIGICCDFTEYNSLEELRGDYRNMPDSGLWFISDDPDAITWLNDRTTVIPVGVTERIIVQNF